MTTEKKSLLNKEPQLDVNVGNKLWNWQREAEKWGHPGQTTDIEKK